MIEPQNTMLPIATATATVDAPHSDVTFGEMLAKTLGMTPQLETDAVTAIAGEETDTGQSPVDAETEGDTRHLDKTISRKEQFFVGVVPTRQFSITRPSDTVPVATEPVIIGDEVEPTVPDPATPVVGPVRKDTDPTLPVVGPEDLPGAGVTTVDGGLADAAPVAPEITEPTPAAGAAETPAVPDGSAQVPTQRDFVDPVPVEGDTAPAERDRVSPTPVEPGKLPVAGDGDTYEQMPVITPAKETSPSDDVDLEPVSAGRIVSGDVVVKPAPPIDPQQDQSAAAALQPAAPVTASGPVPVEEAAVSLGAEHPVQVTDSKIELEPASSHGTDRIVSLSPEPVTHSTSAVSSFTSPAAPTQHTALAERVLQAVELQANQPPPRTMIVDIPELEGLRLVVSVRSGAAVHVVPTSSSPASAGLQPFMSELESVLADRGFVMTGDGRRRGGNEYQRGEEELPRRARPSINRPTDNDLRI